MFGGKDSPNWEAFISAYGVEHIDQLSFSQANEIINILSGRPNVQRQAHYRGGEKPLLSQKQANEIARMEAVVGWYGDDRRLAALCRRLCRNRFRGMIPLADMISMLTTREAGSLIYTLRRIQSRQEQVNG
jgi:hypothetical protein